MKLPTSYTLGICMIFINSPNSESRDELQLICPKEEVVSPQCHTEKGRGSAFQSPYTCSCLQSLLGDLIALQGD